MAKKSKVITDYAYSRGHGELGVLKISGRQNLPCTYSTDMHIKDGGTLWVRRFEIIRYNPTFPSVTASEGAQPCGTVADHCSWVINQHAFTHRRRPHSAFSPHWVSSSFLVWGSAPPRSQKHPLGHLHDLEYG